MEKEQNFAAVQAKLYCFKIEREIAANNDMWLTYQRKNEAKSSSSRAVAKILNFLSKSSFAADTTSSVKNF